MKTAAEIANHPKARLHQNLVEILRASGSTKGAEQTWVRLRRVFDAAGEVIAVKSWAGDFKEALPNDDD
jgi:hypothetical protein